MASNSDLDRGQKGVVTEAPVISSAAVRVRLEIRDCAWAERFRGPSSFFIAAHKSPSL